MKTIEDIRKHIDDDLTWMFDIGDVSKIEIEKSLEKEWDYILRLKFNPPTPFEILKLEQNINSFKELMSEYSYDISEEET